MIFTQTDSAAVCATSAYCESGVSNSTTYSKQASVGGTAGSTPVTVNMDAGSAIFLALWFECIVPAGTTWAAGDWTIRLNCTTANMNLSLAGGYAICRISSACAGNNDIVDSGTGPTIGLDTTGVKEWTVAGLSQTPAVGDKVMIILKIQNSAMTAQSFAFTPDQNIDSPFTAAAVFIAPPPKLITQQSRNRASLY